MFLLRDSENDLYHKGIDNINISLAFTKHA